MAVRGRVLIVKPSSLGDIVHSLPTVTALSRCGMEVHFAARRQYRDILNLCPAVSRILDFPSRIAETPAFLKDLRRLEYDAVIDLQGLLRSALATAFARTSKRIGLPDSREGSIFFYHETAVYLPEVLHAVERYLSVLNRISDADPPNAPTSPPDFGLVLPNEAIVEAERLCGEAGYVIFSPLARHAGKMWLDGRWVELADVLSARKLRIVVVGHGPSNFPGSGPAWTNLIGRTSLPVLCAVISRARLCVTVDSAPMHLAAALGVPVVALFGPTDPSKVGPYIRRRMVLRASQPRLADLSCLGVASVVVSEIR